MKTIGYLISALSVVLLGIVAWKSAADDRWLMLCLLGGMACSTAGMLLRWISYQRD